VDKDNTTASSQFDQNQSGVSDPAEKNIDSQVAVQNKYPKYDVGGDNYSQVLPTANGNPPLSSEVQENLNQPSPALVDPVQNSTNPVIGNIQANSPNTATHESGSNPKYASIRMRFSAFFLDGLIIGLIAFIFNLPIFISQFKNITTKPDVNIELHTQQVGQTYQVPTQPPTPFTNPLYLVLSIIPYLIGIIYYIYFIGKDGATPGKKHYGVKVVDKTTLEAPGYLKAFLREIIGKFASQLFFSLGYFWAIWDEDKQAWHDKIAGTVVINTK